VTGDITITALKKVVEKVVNPMEEISLKEARNSDPSKVVDDIESPIAVEDFGRITGPDGKAGALSAGQEAEKRPCLKNTKDKAGQICAGSSYARKKWYYWP
jgi:N utilization substance protein A